ncbi:MAG: Vms1/Ankzf1 family peptidyl-tRNA hydrolase [Haloarculaceae archaeon]
MLDELLGRAALKDRIAELEAERESLENQFEAEADRRADATTARQEAERQVNRLEDKVAELEDRVERATGTTGEREFAAEASLRRAAVETVLDRLASYEGGPEDVFTAYVADGTDLAEAVRDAFGSRTPLVGRAAPCLAVTDEHAILGATLSVPVAPSPFATWSDAVAFDRDWFEPTGAYTLALVRSDLFAMGTYEGRERTAFHGFDSELQEQHSKGGFSQARFERLRDEQIEDHLGRCRAALEEREADRLYVVGERSVIWELSDLADVTRPVDATGDPEPALVDAVESFWTVELRAL